MVDEQLLVRLPEEVRVYPTVVFWKLITVGLAVNWQVEAPIAGTVTFCPLTVMVCSEACSWICTVLATPGSGSPKVSLLTGTETVDDPEGEKVLAEVQFSGVGVPTGTPLHGP